MAASVIEVSASKQQAAFARKCNLLYGDNLSSVAFSCGNFVVLISFFFKLH